jgi:hypothetical protein
VTWTGGDTVFCAHHDGTRWLETERFGIGYTQKGMLCCDHRGRVWALWVGEHPADDTFDLLVRYYDGSEWSDPSVVVTDNLYVWPTITAALDRVWVVWTRWKSASRFVLYYRHTLPTGIAERGRTRLEGIRISPSVLRPGASLNLSGLPPGARVVLLDVSGRIRFTSGSSLIPLPSSLAPSLFFIRASSGSQSTVSKVLVVR